MEQKLNLDELKNNLPRADEDKNLNKI